MEHHWTTHPSFVSCPTDSADSQTTGAAREGSLLTFSALAIVQSESSPTSNVRKAPEGDWATELLRIYSTVSDSTTHGMRSVELTRLQYRVC